jgi:O-antigen/teichoic acid export membrane protein
MSSPVEPLSEAAEATAQANAEAGGVMSIGGDPLMPPVNIEAPPAPVKFEALGKNALLFAGAALISKVLSFVMLPLYTHYLSVADYGALELVENSLDVLTIVAGSRLLGGVFRFYYKARTDDERRGVISTSLWIVCGGYAVAGSLALLLAQPIAHYVLGSDQYTGLVRLGAVSAITSAPTFVPGPYFRAMGRFRLIVGAQLARLSIQVILNVLLLTVAHLGARAMFLSTIVANSCIGAVLVVLAVRGVGLRYVRTVARDLYRFGLPLMATQVATFVLTYGDRPFLRASRNLTYVGNYTLAYQFAFLLPFLAQTPIEMVLSPKRYELADRSDRHGIYAQMFLYQNFILLTGAVGICLFVRVGLQLLTPPAYWPAANVVPILLIAMVLQAWTAAQDIGISISERTKWTAIANWLAAVAVFAGYALLIPRWGSWGAAIATVIGYLVRYAGAYVKSQQLWPVRYNWPPVMWLLALSTGIVIAGVLLPAGPLALAIVARVSLFAVYVTLAWKLPILTEAERQAARRLGGKLLDGAVGVLKRAGTENAVPS